MSLEFFFENMVQTLGGPRASQSFPAQVRTAMDKLAKEVKAELGQDVYVSV